MSKRSVTKARLEAAKERLKPIAGDIALVDDIIKRALTCGDADQAKAMLMHAFCKYTVALAHVDAKDSDGVIRIMEETCQLPLRIMWKYGWEDAPSHLPRATPLA